MVESGLALRDARRKVDWFWVAWWLQLAFSTSVALWTVMSRG